MSRFRTLAAWLLLLAAGAAAAGTQYTYDDLNRLTKVTYDDGRSITYTYDAAGNLLNVVNSAGPGWCGLSLNFDGNRLPPQWSSALIRSGPGIRNNRLEAAPTDSGVVVVSNEAPISAGASSVVVDFNDSRTFSFWGQFNNIQVKTLSGHWWIFSDGNFAYRTGSREFNVMRAAAPWPNASTTTLLHTVSRAMGFGTFKTRLTLRNGSAQWDITDAALSRTTVTLAMPPDFKVSDVVAVSLGVYTTTDGSAWIDDVGIRCE